jgi:molybdopterin-binding protein
LFVVAAGEEAAVDRPRCLSARNSFSGRVLSIRREGVAVIVMIEAGATFEVHLTPGAIDYLALKAGTPIWMVIKP